MCRVRVFVVRRCVDVGWWKQVRHEAGWVECAVLEVVWVWVWVWTEGGMMILTGAMVVWSAGVFVGFQFAVAHEDAHGRLPRVSIRWVRQEVLPGVQAASAHSEGAQQVREGNEEAGEGGGQRRGW